MTGPSIPRADAHAAAWMSTFAGQLARRPDLYRVAAATADDVAARVAAFADALRACADRPNRSPVVVFRKNAARAEAEATCRAVYGQIKVDAGVPDTAKVEVGVRPLNRSRTRRNRPASAPVAASLRVADATHVVRFRDADAPTNRGKPRSAGTLQVFVRVGDAPCRDVAEARLLEVSTRAKVRVAYRPADGGKWATYFARWASPSGAAGPWSAPISARVAA